MTTELERPITDVIKIVSIDDVPANRRRGGDIRTILSPATVGKSDDERCASVVGSGPFVLDSYTPNASLVLTTRLQSCPAGGWRLAP